MSRFFSRVLQISSYEYRSALWVELLEILGRIFVCHGCGTYCNLEGMCFRCFTWTCEECAPSNKCPKCKAEINV